MKISLELFLELFVLSFKNGEMMRKSRDSDFRALNDEDLTSILSLGLTSYPI